MTQEEIKSLVKGAKKGIATANNAVDILSTELLNINEMSLTAQSLRQAIPFATSVNFRGAMYSEMAVHTMTADVVLAKDTAGAKIGNTVIIPIIADGTHTVDTSAFTTVAGSQEYNNTNGVLNIFNIWYSAGQYFMLISMAAEDLVPTYNAESAAFFARNTTAGGTFNSTQQSAINTFIETLKTNSLYDAIVEMGLMRGGSAATNALGFKNAHNTTFTGTWTHSATGSVGNGVSGTYGDTGVVPNTHLTITDLAISFYSGTNGVNGGDDFSSCDNLSDTANLRMIIKNAGTTDGYFDVGDGRVTTTVADSRGLFTVKRVGTTITAYRNGAIIGTPSTSAAGTLPTFPLFLGANDLQGRGGGALTANASQNECRFWSASAARSDAEETIFYNAVQAMLTAFSSNL